MRRFVKRLRIAGADVHATQVVRQEEDDVGPLGGLRRGQSPGEARAEREKANDSHPITHGPRLSLPAPIRKPDVPRRYSSGVAANRANTFRSSSVVVSPLISVP